MEYIQREFVSGGVDNTLSSEPPCEWLQLQQISVRSVVLYDGQ